jgi:hypothetical protein
MQSIPKHTVLHFFLLLLAAIICSDIPNSECIAITGVILIRKRELLKTVKVNNFANINKTNNHLSPYFIEHIKNTTYETGNSCSVLEQGNIQVNGMHISKYDQFQILKILTLQYIVSANVF